MDTLGNSEATVDIAILSVQRWLPAAGGCDTAVPRAASGLDQAGYAASPCKFVQLSLHIAVPHLPCDPQWSSSLSCVGWELVVEIEEGAHDPAS